MTSSMQMLDPVLAVRRIKSHLRCKQHSLSYSGEASSCKKAKMSSSSSSFEIPVLPSPVIEGSRKEVIIHPTALRFKLVLLVLVFAFFH